MSAIDVGAFLGPCFMLCCISLILFGAICTQGYTYWNKCRDDSPKLRYTVLFVFLLEFLHTAMLLHFLYHYLITMAFNVVGLNRIVWTAGSLIIDAVCIIAFVQGFYIYRIYQLSNCNQYAVVALGISLILRTGLAISAAILVILSGTCMAMLDSRTMHILLSLSLGMNAITDALLTFLFTLYLHKCRTDFRSTQGTVGTLMAYTINTGALTIVASFLVMIMFLTSQTLMFAGMYTVVGKLYANSMLAQLNARGRTQERIPTTLRRSPLGPVEMGIRLDAVGQRSLYHEDASISDKGIIGR